MDINIVNGDSLKIMENKIKEAVRSCEYWGDLELSISDLEVLRDRIKTILNVEGMTINYICKNYPHAITTFMVFFVRYKYDTNFWGALGEELGIEIPVNVHPVLGSCAKTMFAQYGMDISDTKDEPHQIIAPIIYEACLPPESSLDDLFYILSYDAYKVFDPYLIVDELIEMRSYTIRKPMYRFLSRFKDSKALEYLLEVRDSMLSVEQNSMISSRYAESYEEWKKREKDKSGIAARKKQEFQTRPYLFFDNGRKGLCIILPHTVMSKEWVDEVTWSITGSSGFEKKVKCTVYGDEGRRFTDVLSVAVAPSERYRIRLEDNESFEDTTSEEWEIDGIRKDRIICFNSNGRLVSTNYLLYPYGILLIPDEVVLRNTKDLVLSEQFYPNESADIRVVSAAPLSDEAFLEYETSGAVYHLSARPQINMYLQGKTLFSLPSETNLFTEIPVLTVAVDRMISMSNLEIKVGDLTYPLSFEEGREITIDLVNFVSNYIKKYGTYAIRLYQFGKFVKQLEFSYIPMINTDYRPLTSWISLTQQRRDIVYKFAKIDDWEMGFEQCMVDTTEDCYIVTVPSDMASVNVSLKSLKEDFIFSCEMELPVRPLETELTDAEGNLIEKLTNRIARTDLETLLDNENWIAVHAFGPFRNSLFEVRLRTGNGIEQTEKISLAQNGAGNFNLSVFSDTLRACLLPAQIEIACEDGEDNSVVLMAVSEKSELKRKVRYSITPAKSYVVLNVLDDGRDIEVTRFGFEGHTVYIPYSESVLGKSGKTRGYLYPGVLTEGLYVVSGEKGQSLFDFEEEETVELTLANNVFLVSCRGKEKAEISTSKEWLDQLISDLINIGVSRDLEGTESYGIFHSPKEFENLKKSSFDDCDIEKLAALGYFVNSRILNVNKQVIRACMRGLSGSFLGRNDRYRILQLLTKLKAPREVFDICMQEYALMLYSSIDHDVSILASEAENYSVELSMMLMMSSNGSIRDCVWREKYRELIGKDAIRKLLSVPEEEEPEKISAEQRKFLRELPGCKVKINLDDEISGNEEAIQGMIGYDRRYNPTFDITKKPDYGVYFGRVKYVDQYVNWFKSNHNAKLTLNPEKRERMIESVKKYFDPIRSAVNALKSDAALGSMAGSYADAIRYRFHEGTSIISFSTLSYPRYFYLQGLAAFLARLPVEREDLDEYRNLGSGFMMEAFRIAPKLSQRDILMAETYRYLKRKEEMLCQ